jgi:hypothetical protein
MKGLLASRDQLTFPEKRLALKSIALFYWCHEHANRGNSFSGGLNLYYVVKGGSPKALGA